MLGLIGCCTHLKKLLGVCVCSIWWWIHTINGIGILLGAFTDSHSLLIRGLLSREDHNNLDNEDQ